MDWKRLARVLRAVLARDSDFEAPSRRTASGVAYFLAGVGTGVLLGAFFAPVSGERLRTEVAGRARQGFEKAKAKTQEFAGRQKVPSGETAATASAEKNAS